MPIRCPWVGEDPLMQAYHDLEWGAPVHEDRVHFEFLVLESAQAGLSWRTVLHRREGFRRAFAGFDPRVVAAFDDRIVEELLQEQGIIRNRAKIRAAITNARALLTVQEQEGSFDAFLWSFVGGVPKVNRWTAPHQLPATSPEAEALSKALKSRGFTFVGPTVMYAHMQACGLVNDHLVDCFRYRQLTGE